MSPKKEGSNLQPTPSNPRCYTITRFWSDILHIHNQTPQRTWSISDPEVYRLRITNTHSNRQTIGSIDSCFASTFGDASQRTTPFNIRKVITPDSTSSQFILIHKTSTVSLQFLLKFICSRCLTRFTRRNGKRKELSLAPDYRVCFLLSILLSLLLKIVSSPKLPDPFFGYLDSIFYTAKNFLSKRSSDLFPRTSIASSRSFPKIFLEIRKLPSEASRPPFESAMFPFTVAAHPSEVRRHHP